MTPYEELRLIRARLIMLSKHKDLLEASENVGHGKFGYTCIAANSVLGAVESLDDALSTYEKYNGLGEFAPTAAQERDRQMQEAHDE